jgi:hypothetical protein
MHPQQLKKKASRPLSSRVIEHLPGRSTSYLKTRIRGSRLQNAARILVLVELTQRLHQAYRFAYDKQASDQLLPQNPESVDLVTIEHFNDSHTRDIRAAVKRLFSDPCTAAFRKYGLTPPIESQLAGIIIRPATDLINLSPEQLGISDQTRNAYREQFFGNTANSNAQGGTIPGSRNGKNITPDGRAQVYLAGSAWAGESYLFNTFSFQDVVSHEFIHVGGQPPTPGKLGSWRHDLAGFKGFDEILKACR